MRKTDYFCCIVLLAMLILGGWGSTVPSPERMDEARADVEQAKHLIVYVESSKPGGGIIFHLDRDHLFIATAMHVVRMPEDDEVEIEFEFLPGHSVKAERLSFESSLDLAVLRVNLNEVVNFPVDSIPVDQIGYVVGEKYVKKDDTVYPIGFPGGEKWYYPRSSSPKVIDIVGEAIQFDYMCETGDSGGGLFNERWELVGMVQRASGRVCRAISFERIHASLVGDWRLGVSLKPIGAKPPPPTDSLGTLVIGAYPWGQLFIDDTLIIERLKALVELPLLAKSHTVRVVHPTRGEWEREVMVPPGGRTDSIFVKFLTLQRENR